MCLSIPGKLVSVYSENGMRMGKVDFGGVAKEACLEHVQEAVAGDYVLVHVGFALSRIDEEEARRIFQLLKELGAAEELAAGEEGESPEAAEEERAESAYAVS
jgi:hydrogenase expression/formation protein HypC